MFTPERPLLRGFRHGTQAWQGMIENGPNGLLIRMSWAQVPPPEPTTRPPALWQVGFSLRELAPRRFGLRHRRPRWSAVISLRIPLVRPWMRGECRCEWWAILTARIAGYGRVAICRVGVPSKG
jgi:hypothetical protein